MENDNAEIIEKVLKEDPQDIAFEPIPGEEESPLAQPVVKKSDTSGDVSASRKNPNPLPRSEQDAPKQFSDAPQQEINADPEKKKEEGPKEEEEKDFYPLEYAQMAADSIMGTFNNTVLEIGGGYFVTIRKHEDFYDFEEIIQVIDEQNAKNIKRLKLDEEDKALLRPLLIQILRKKSVALSPEKQLLMVALSILIKKAKVVMEIRAENELLVERIRDIIRKEVQAAKAATEDPEEESEETEEKTVPPENPQQAPDPNKETQLPNYEEIVTYTGLPAELEEPHE